MITELAERRQYIDGLLWCRRGDSTTDMSHPCPWQGFMCWTVPRFNGSRRWTRRRARRILAAFQSEASKRRS